MNAKIIWSTGESYEQSSRFQQDAVKPEPKYFIPSSTPQMPSINKPRESLDFQIASRDMFTQRGMNPFLDASNSSNNYSDHIAIQNTHLQPIDTSMTDRSISKN